MRSITIVSLVSWLITSAMNPVSAAKPDAIRIGFSGGKPASTILALAYQQGALEEEFKADGIAVKWNFFTSNGPGTNEAAAKGLIDFAYQGDLPMIVGRSTGVKTRILFSLGRFGKIYFVVPTDSEARSLADLKGKRIGTTKGTIQQLNLNRLLDKYGLDPRDFRIVNADSLSSMITTKDIDGAITQPFELQARGAGKTILELPRDPAVTGLYVFWVAEEFEAQHPDIVQRVVNRLIRVAREASDEANRETVFRTWSRQGAFPYIDAVRSWEGDRLAERHSPLLDEYFRASLQRSIDQTVQFGLMRKPVKLEGWLAAGYLEKALRVNGLEGYWPAFDAAGRVLPAVERGTTSP